MNTRQTMTFLAALLALAGCTREEDMQERVSGLLKVQIETAPTRTSISDTDGKFTWVTGDKIDVFLGSSFYESAVNATDGTLVLPSDQGARTGYAVYPSGITTAGKTGVNSDLEINLPASYNIAADPDSEVSPLPMVAKNDPDSDVLNFYHVGGILRINCTAPAGVHAVRVNMNKGVTGAYTVNDPGTDNPTIAPGNSASSVTFIVSGTDESPTVLDAQAYVVLNVPLPTFTTTDGYTCQTIEMLDASGTVIAGETLTVNKSFSLARAHGKRITPVAGDFVIEAFDPYDLTYEGGTSTTGSVVSYKDVNGTRTIEPWTVIAYYPTREDANNGTNGYATLTEFNNHYTSWVSAFQNTGIGALDGESVSMTYGLASSEETTIADMAVTINEEISNSTFGEGSSPSKYYNLANPGNMSSDYIVESANSYVVNGPGYYKIPLVMGNGVKDNAIYQGINGNGYNYKGFEDLENSTPVAKYYKNYMDDEIVNPVLQLSSSGAGTPTSAYVVWEDPKLIAVEDETDWKVKAYGGNNCITLSSTTLSNGESFYWLNIHVTGQEQGNAVIAVCDETGTVMWSYHIWMTNFKPFTGDIPVTHASNTGITYQLMPCNLGWLYEGSGTGMKYFGNAMYVKIRQDNSGLTAVMELKRPEMSIATAYHDGYGPAFQWGFPVPFHPIGRGNMKDTVAGGRNKSFSRDQQGYQKTIGNAINNPGVFHGTNYDPNGNTPTTWSNYYAMRNMWNCNMDDDATFEAQASFNNYIDYKHTAVGKTIYDPCPAGYSVPAPGAFDFRPNNETGRQTKHTFITQEGYKAMNVANWYLAGSTGRLTGYQLYTDATKTQTIFFPASGYRQYTNGSASTDVNTAGYFWVASRANVWSGGAFTIYYNYGNTYYGINLWHYMPQSDGFCVRPMQNSN